MPKIYATKLVIKVLENKGFFFVSQNGSHAKYRKVNGLTLTVIVPIHAKDLPMVHFSPFYDKLN